MVYFSSAYISFILIAHSLRKIQYFIQKCAISTNYPCLLLSNFSNGGASFGAKIQSGYCVAWFLSSGQYKLTGGHVNLPTFALVIFISWCETVWNNIYDAWGSCFPLQDQFLLQEERVNPGGSTSYLWGDKVFLEFMIRFKKIDRVVQQQFTFFECWKIMSQIG